MKKLNNGRYCMTLIVMVATGWILGGKIATAGILLWGG